MDVLVTVIIVTWNRKDDVLIAVQSVFEQTYHNVEIVVIDNASQDGTVEALRQWFPAIKLITLDENKGVSVSRNIGIEAARGDIIFLLDSDASLAPDTLVKVVRKFQSDAQIGIVACKIINSYTMKLCTSAWIYSEKSKVDQHKEFYSYSFCECGSAIRKHVFDQVGLFWDLLFFGREGDELSLRVWEAGYQIVFVPSAVVYHRVSSHERKEGIERLKLDLRNSLSIYFVRYPWWMLVRFVPLKIGISLMKAVRRGGVGTILRTSLAIIPQLPALLKHRQPIQGKTARLYMQLLREHGPLSWSLMAWLRHKV